MTTTKRKKPMTMMTRFKHFLPENYNK